MALKVKGENMNYDKLYYQIIERAIKETRKAIRYKGNGTYYELHHIIPRSLGGLDKANNLVLLTAKEHYICHWLLVKRNDIGSVARNKMIKAWYMMAACGKTQRHKLRNMNDYAKYRNEMSNVMHNAQIAKKNSQWGKHWYTNYETGESKSFFTKPSNKWVLGRYVFNGQSSKLFYNFNQTNKIKKRERPNRIIFLQTLRDKGKRETEILWNRYHSGNYNKLEEFSKEIGITKVALYFKFKKYIPIYSKHTEIKRSHFPSNKDLINIFN